MRTPTLDQQIADLRQVLQQRRRIRASLKPSERPKAAEVADRRIRLAEATLALLEQLRDAETPAPTPPPPMNWIVTAPRLARRRLAPARVIVSRHPSRSDAEAAAERLGAMGLHVAYYSGPDA